MSLLVRENRAVLASDVLSNWGADTGFEPSSPRYSGAEAFKVAAVVSCVGLRAGVFAQLPLRAYRDGPDGLPVLVEQPALLADPSFTLPAAWKIQMSFSRDLWGFALGLIVRTDSAGLPAQVEWLPPWQCSAVTVGAGGLRWTVNGSPVASERLLHVPSRWVMPGNPVGVAPLEQAGLVELARVTQQFGRDWFTSGVVPSVVVKSDQALTQDQAEQISDAVARRWRKRKPAVMGSGLSLEAVAVKGDDSQMIATMQQIKGDIATVFNLPPEKIGGATGSGSLTYGNRESNQDQILVDAMNADLVIIEQAMSRHLKPGTFAQWNTAAFLRSDAKTRAEIDNLKITNGTLTVDEARKHDGLGPMPKGATA